MYVYGCVRVWVEEDGCEYVFGLQLNKVDSPKPFLYTANYFQTRKKTWVIFSVSNSGLPIQTFMEFPSKQPLHAVAPNVKKYVMLHGNM